MRKPKTTLHNSKKLQVWNNVAKCDLSMYCIMVDSSEWGESQCYESSHYPMEVDNDWICKKIKELEAIPHLTKATITLYRRLYSWDNRRKAYAEELIKHKTISM